jgi:hypothetical protein
MFVIDFVSKGRGWRQAGETTIGICFVGQGFEPCKIANLKVCPTIHNPKFIIQNP